MEKNKYKNRLGKQYKSLNFYAKEVLYDSGSRTISGYAAVFNNIDKSGDMLLRGCFSKSINERGPESAANDKIIMLWMHDMNEPIGRITSLAEDEKGLYFEAAIDDVERGNQAIKQLESGTLNQFSIGYSYVWEKCEYDRERDCFVVKEVILYEISVVSVGCNGETEYLGLKSAEEYNNILETLPHEIDDVCKGLPVKKREEVQLLIRKAMSLAQYKPVEKPLVEEGADKIKIFGNIKLK